MATLNHETLQRIDSIIDDIALRTGISTPGSALGELAEIEGLTVIEADLTDIRRGLSGILQYDDDKTKKNPVIYIHGLMSRVRKRFTLAHELGHHFLHEGVKLRLDVLDYANDHDALEESEANYFAASLLVPEGSLRKKMQDIDNIKDLAEYYDVSEAVIINRIKWINAN